MFHISINVCKLILYRAFFLEPRLSLQSFLYYAVSVYLLQPCVFLNALSRPQLAERPAERAASHCPKTRAQNAGRTVCNDGPAIPWTALCPRPAPPPLPIKGRWVGTGQGSFHDCQLDFMLRLGGGANSTHCNTPLTFPNFWKTSVEN